ncbi:MAG: hypothetical protein AUK37_04065 [Rhodobacterales bacterium CG2_30_65_12]|nr:MAG: hypothetical protein AUK37_04065 [Rhodobacterales bacterium CG2_30_65_12]
MRGQTKIGAKAIVAAIIAALATLAPLGALAMGAGGSKPKPAVRAVPSDEVVPPVPSPTPPVAPPPAPGEIATTIPFLDTPAAPPPDLEFPTPTPLPDQVSWATYVNPRFGLRLDYPKGLFLPAPPPENGDGQAFSALDGAARFSVWGSYNVLGETAQTLMAGFAATLTPGNIISSQLTGTGGFQTIALRADKRVFRTEIAGGDVVFGFEAEVDDPDDAALADLFETIMDSLRGPEASTQTAPPAPAQPASLFDILVATAKGALEPVLGQSVALDVTTLRRAGAWAYLGGVPTQPDGAPLDWLATPFAPDWQADAMSDVVMVLMAEENSAWRVVDSVIGPTDVAWYGWVAQYGLPETLFYEP